MSTEDCASHLPAELSMALAEALPGWRCRTLPQPFSWAPEMHFRTTICAEDRERSVILRRSWSGQAHHRECFLYRHVLPNLPIRTAGLLGTFQTDGEQPHCWMVLEDLGLETADLAAEPQLRLALQALGALHGSRPQERPDWPGDAPLQRFPQGRFVYEDWRGVFDGTLSKVDARLGSWVADLLASVLEALGDMPQTLLHGDAVAGNMIPCEGRIGLIDWEHASIGPCSVDLGTFLNQMCDSQDLEAYCAGWRFASGTEWPLSAARHDAELGLAHESLRWLAYYAARLRKANPPDQEWRSRYLDPRIDQLVDFRCRWS